VDHATFCDAVVQEFQAYHGPLSEPLQIIDENYLDLMDGVMEMRAELKVIVVM
jgi:hypothetical protein